ncbi:MAG: hypothetical protein WBZ57_22005 [Pseudomonas graminis]
MSQLPLASGRPARRGDRLQRDAVGLRYHRRPDAGRRRRAQKPGTAALPAAPPGGSLIVALLLGLLLLSVPARCMITVLLTGLRGHEFEVTFASGAAERLFAVVAGITALVSIAVTVGAAQLRERSRRAATAQWSRQICRWQQSWYCHRCHTAFVAGSSQAAAPEQLGQMLMV